MQKPVLFIVLAAVALGAFFVGAGVGPSILQSQNNSVMLGGAAPSDNAIRDFILNNPDVIIQSMRNYEQTKKTEKQAAAKAALKTQFDALYSAPLSPVVGNPAGTITLVEFFDFNCGYCKKAATVMQDAITQNPDLKIIHKQLPILGESSVLAAKAALAAARQNKYDAFYTAAIGHDGALNAETLEKIATTIGLDKAQYTRDITDPAFDTEIQANYTLAETLGMTGTPAFVIGDDIIYGMLSPSELADKLKTLRTAKKAE